MFCAVVSLSFGLVYDLFGTYPRRPDDPADVDAEYEPEETVEVLEQAVRGLGHRPLRLGNPHALLATLGKGELPGLDVARADFRLDAEDRPRFLEMNPLPTFAPDGSFGILAEIEGRALADLLAEVIAGGLERLGLG
jgi:hypothetical protein